MFGDRLKGLREERQLSQRAVADKLGVTQQAVAKWEAGKAEPDIATINKLADLFGVSVNLLLGALTPRSRESERPPGHSGAIYSRGTQAAFA